MELWWERFPTVYDEEIAGLDHAGIRYERDEKAWDEGILVLKLWPIVGGREVELIAVFPDLYPFFRFDVIAPKEALERHQHPFGKSLCLIGRATIDWDVDDRLAWFIQNQVPKVLALGDSSASEAELAEGEQHQGEPFSDYYPYAPGAAIIIDSGWEIPPGNSSGTLRLVVESRGDALLRGVVSAVLNAEGQVVGTYPVPKGPFTKELKARWYRMPSELRTDDPHLALKMVSEAHGGWPPDKQPLGQFAFDVVGVVFPEEVAWRESGDGWVFIVEWRPSKRSGQKRPRAEHYFARAHRAGANDLAERIPELSVLREKTVAIMGLGGLGAPSALELARSQVGVLRLADHDHVDAGTGVRWPLGLPFAGLSKSQLGNFISTNWPHVRVESFTPRLGTSASGKSSGGDLEFVENFLDGADLVFDASAELGIQYYLSEEARRRGVPYISLDATTGAWGGRVLRIVPGETEGCWMCSRYAFDSGGIHLPPADPAGEVQPTGCADPTFTGTSFDLLQVVATAVRLAVATLCRGVGGYPDVDWDAGILKLRDEAGTPQPAVWDTASLTRHPSCPVCS